MMKKILVSLGCLLVVGVASSVSFADDGKNPEVHFRFDNTLEFSSTPDHAKMVDSCTKQCDPYKPPASTAQGFDHCKSCCVGAWPAKGKTPTSDVFYEGVHGCHK